MGMITEAKQTYIEYDGEILEQIYTALAGIDIPYWIVENKQVNKEFTVKIHTAKIHGYSDRIVQAMKTLPCIYSLHKKQVVTSTKEFDYVQYTFRFFLKYEYFNKILNTNKVMGKFLQYLFDNDINDIIDLRNALLPMLDNISKYAHVVEDGAEKRKLRETKLHIIKMLYMNNLFDGVYAQKSYSNDELVLFTCGEWGFHLRAANVRFLTKPAQLVEAIYEKKEHIEENINLSFVPYLVWLDWISQPKMLEIAEFIKPNRNEWE